MLSYLALLLGVIISKTSHLDYTFEWRHSLYSPYVNADGHSHQWDIDGVIDSHHFIQLTPELPGRSGHVYSKTPYVGDDWFLEMTFQIKCNFPHNSGDGMALWFTEDPFKPGQAFGNQERFKGLGVFIDLFPNSKHSYKFPYISAMVNDGTKAYDHFKDGEGQILGGCHAKILNSPHPVHTKVIYHNNVLEVLLFTHQESGWTPCFKASNVRLPKSGYIGVSALTGDATAEHNLIGLTTGSLSTTSSDSFANAELDEFERRHSTFFFIVLFICLGAFGYHYRKNQRRKSVF